MGAYLSMAYLAKPVKEKESGDFDTEKLRCGYSTMQGWRTNQEDYYTVIKDFDTDSSFFAVFDGHGGHEVAKYCSENLAQFLKEHPAYKEGDIEKALIDGFLDFDELFVKPEIVDILKEWVQQRKEKDQNKKDKYLETMERKMLERLRNSKQKKDKGAEGDAEESGNADSLCKDLLEEYKTGKGTSKKKDPSNEAAASSNSRNEDSEEEENIDSLFEEAHMPIEAVLEKYKGGKEASAKESVSDDGVASSSSSSGAACSSSSGSSSEKVLSSSSSKSSEAEAKPTNGDTSGSNSGTCEADCVSSSCADSSSPAKDKDKKEKASNSNGEIPSARVSADSSCSKESKMTVSRGPGKRPLKINKQQLVDGSEDSDDDSEDEGDETFVGPDESSEDDDDDDDEEVMENEGSGESSEEDEDDENEEEEDLDEEEEEDLEEWKRMLEYTEKPGVDSGTTATCAILRGNELFVAHAGDSRAVLARRDGKAEDVTLDHKPQDQPELDRITKAGGKVCSEGRINGGLNLSRAFGDHKHKQNKDLSNREQMVTVLPEVKKISVDPALHDFVILASDGIWNSMSSQEVVDFFKKRICSSDNISKICEELFDECLAGSTFYDASGCDNMTMIVVQFKQESRKRPTSPTPSADEQQTAKKAKTEEEKQPPVESTV